MGTIFCVNPFQPGSIDSITGCPEMTSSWKVHFLTSPPHFILISSFALPPSRCHLSSKNQGLKNYGSFIRHFFPHKIFRWQSLYKKKWLHLSGTPPPCYPNVISGHPHHWFFCVIFWNSNMTIFSKKLSYYKLSYFHMFKIIVILQIVIFVKFSK